MNKFISHLFVTFVCAAMIGCATMTSFDQNTYDAAGKIKAEAVALIQKGSTPASLYPDDILRLETDLSSELAYEEGKGKANTISCEHWKILASEDHDLLGKFLKFCKAGQTYSTPYLQEKKRQISDAIDEIVRLEAAKTH